jgi:hypothetical protein
MRQGVRHGTLWCEGQIFERKRGFLVSDPAGATRLNHGINERITELFVDATRNRGQKPAKSETVELGKVDRRARRSHEMQFTRRFQA